MTWNPLRRFRRRRSAKRPLRVIEQEIVDENLPWVASMPGEDRERFFAQLKMFVDEKRFEGVGIAITDTIRVVIAACAARLSRNIGFSIYDDIGSVVVYPDAFVVPRAERGPSGFDAGADPVVALGVHHAFGTIVLSWASVQSGLKNPNDGHDTALHEFAHAIDAADGAHDGTPPMQISSTREWARVFSRHFRALQQRPTQGIVRAYGATNEAEFFAVATEAFFEKPRAMMRKAPEIYELLRDYYRVDPARER
jgi:Mlc titration factor MtfA (ptsG expression regulator)